MGLLPTCRVPISLSSGCENICIVEWRIHHLRHLPSPRSQSTPSRITLAETPSLSPLPSRNNPKAHTSGTPNQSIPRLGTRHSIPFFHFIAVYCPNLLLVCCSLVLAVVVVVVVVVVVFFMRNTKVGAGAFVFFSSLLFSFLFSFECCKTWANEARIGKAFLLPCLS